MTRGFAAIVAGVTLLAATAEARADTSKTTIPQGYDLGDIEHPRGVAMGGAQAALGTSTAAIYLNPANLPLARVYHFEAIGAYNLEAQRQQYGGAIADSSTNRIAGGFGGTWSMMDPSGIHRSWTDLRLAIAYPFGDIFSAGVTGRYLRLEEAVNAGPLGRSLASSGTPGDPIYNGFTFDAGATVIPASGVRASVLGRNLTPNGGALAPTQVIGALGYTGGAWSVEGDANVDFTSYSSARGRYMAGGEYFIMQIVPIRVGYRYDDGTKAHALSLGTGYVDRKWSVEGAFRRDVAADHPATLFVLGFRFFYDQTGVDESSPDPF